MSIDMKHIVKLAHLRIDEDKYAEFECEMAEIIAMMKNLPEIENELLLEPENAMILRKDIAETDKFTREELFANAPEIQNGCFSVPKTVE